MILNRIGNKERIASNLIRCFPAHSIYIEPFFGAGGIFFNKPRCNVNFINDYDYDVYNLYNVVMNKKEEFIKLLNTTPVHEKIFYDFKQNYKAESDDVKRAIMFLYLSNFSLYGKMKSIRDTSCESFERLIKNVETTFNYLKGVNIFCCDFRSFFKKIQKKYLCSKTFIYCDPPYLNTTNNYSNGFKEKDFDDLLTLCTNSNSLFAISEFVNEHVINKAKEKNLFVNYVLRRNNLKNRRNEILITNYKIPLLL